MSGHPLPGASIGKASLEDLRRQYELDLFEDFLPFLDRFVVDHEGGGFMTNVDREFYEPGPYDKEFDVEPVKREKVEHLYCVCTRCGQIVQKVKQSLFAEDGTK